MKVSANFKPSTWEENEITRISDKQGITKVSAVFAFSGEITGEASVEYTMFYQDRDAKDPHAGSAVYSGFQRLSVSMKGKKGSFVLEDRGAFVGRAATSKLTILEGSGTGDFANITGTGSYTASEKGAGYELEYEIGR